MTAAPHPEPPTVPARPRRTMTYNEPASCPDLEPAFVDAWHRCRDCTMTSLERMYAVWQAVGYIVQRQLPGDIVECGVWKGGCSMLAGLALQHFGDPSRRLWLYDTFEGMPSPGDCDVDYDGRPAAARYHPRWCHSPLAEVQQNMASVGLTEPQVQYVVGPVEQTLATASPEQVAVLRLDTDWYQSTRREMEHLYPRLVSGGVLIVDDYGHWQGSRKAVDEYLHARGIAMLLGRSDYTGRMGIKP